MEPTVYISILAFVLGLASGILYAYPWGYSRATKHIQARLNETLNRNRTESWK